MHNRSARSTRRAALAAAACLPLVATTLPVANAAAPAPAPRAADPARPGPLDASAPQAPSLITGLAVRSSQRATRTAAGDFLRKHTATTTITAPDATLRATTPTRIGAVTAERYTQVHGGVPVLGGQYVVRVRTDATGATVIGTSGSYFKGLTVSTTPKVSAKGAELAARRLLVRAGVDARSARVRSAGLVVLPVGTGRLAQRVVLTGSRPVSGSPFMVELLVDANNGALLSGWNRLAGLTDDAPGTPVTTTGKRLTTLKVPVNLVQTAPDHYDFIDRGRAMAANGGEIRAYDAKGADAYDYSGTMPADATIASTSTIPLSDAVTKKGLVDAQWAAGEVYDYYKTVLGRDSIDGKGGTMTSVVGVTDGGFPFINAFWDGDKMVYGGGGGGYRPLSASLDVVGHEMTHGVVERSANLLYFGQSGALNEAVADYFGNAIQADTEGIGMQLPEATLLGEDLCVNKPKAACALRDMGDKRTTWQDYQGVVSDGAGVHLNSTIVSGALWDVRKRLGADKTDKLVYAALTQYLTPTSGFTAMRDAMLSAATDSGASAATKTVIKQAFDAHGIVKGWEKQLGVDSTSLMPGIDYVIFGFFLGAQPSAAKGRWTVADTDLSLAGGLGVWGGSTTSASATTRLSPDDGWWHDAPRTDGDTTVWASGNLAEDQPNGRVLARNLASGEVRTVWEGPGTVAATDVSGATITFTVLDAETFTATQWVVTGSGEPRKLDLGGEVMSPPDLQGTILAATLTSSDPESMATPRSVLADVRTGQVTPIPAPEGDSAAVAYPVLTPKSVVTIETNNANRPGGLSVVRRTRTGTTLGEATTLLDGNAEDAMSVLGVTANDTAVTALIDPKVDEGDMTGLTNSSTPKIWQVPATGGEWQRMSCNRGEQQNPAADTGKRVVWIDATNGDPSVVTRPKPAGSCD